MIDPHFRTIIGFEKLISKEWIFFGHKFNVRLGFGKNFLYLSNFFFKESNTSDQISPVFIQFLDCIHQIMEQFPISFQFNQKFLVDISYHLYSSRFGSFLFNNEKVLFLN